MTIRTVLFDLDGTLVDTAPDLTFALNEVLRQHGREQLSDERVRPVVSHGTLGLLELGFGIGPEDPEFAGLREELLRVYADNLLVGSRLFPGMHELIDSIEASQRNWGVVTNKPGWLTEPLLEGLGIAARASCIVSGDTLSLRKPHPAPVLYACERSGSRPAQCVYVGDAERDIEAGRNARTHTLVALFGYLGRDDQPLTWGADALVDCAEDILAWVLAHG